MGETMESVEVIQQLKERHDFERGERWATEEVCAWIVAIETGLLVNDRWHHWWLSVIVGIATFFVVARYFGRREEAPRMRTTALPDSVDTFNLRREKDSRKPT
jgi:hypothetical protein